MIVRVKHLIEYLQTLNPEIEVGLDKDGWMEDEIKPANEVELVEQRGIFDLWEYDEVTHLMINN